MISDEDADRLSDIRARDLRVLKPGTWVDEAISDRRFLVDYVAALEARCRELEAALNAAAYALFQIKRMVPEYIVEHSKTAYAAACVVLNGESTPETSGSGNLVFHDVLNCEKCGKPKIGHPITDRKPEFCQCSKSETKAEPMPVGEHPMGGPCIHVWALTNRSAVEKGKCELCGNSVP